MKAVVMAGGEGTRLRPLTSNRPKPLVPIVNKPVMEHVLLLLKKHGITDIIVTLHFMADEIVNYFGDGSFWDMHITYSIEDEPLGTAGSVKNTANRLNETFLIISADALTDINLTEAIKYHKEKGAFSTIVLTRAVNPLDYGVVITREDGSIRRFLEKPGWKDVFSDTINTGIYIFEPEIFNFMEPKKNYDFSKNIFPQLLKENKLLYGFVADGYWCDIGNLQQYRDANIDALSGKVNLEISGRRVAADIWIDEDSEISQSVEFKGPIVVGKNCRIMDNVALDEFTILGDNCIVEEDCRISHGIIWNNTYIGRKSELIDCTVGSSCTIKRNAVLLDGSVIGDKCFIGEGAVIHPQIKIWPGKNIEPGGTVSMSLIWGSKWPGTLFGISGIRGLANIEITPEFAMKLGSAYGAFLEKGSHVTTSRDSHPASRMINRAFICGLISVGVNCLDLRMMPSPVNRYAVKTSKIKGGIHTRISHDDPDSFLVEFFDERGINIDKPTERAIENNFFREDFRLTSPREVGDIDFPSRIIEEYIERYFDLIDTKTIKKKGFKIVLDYSFGSSSLVLPLILGKLGCESISLNAFLEPHKKINMADTGSNSLQQLSNIVTTLNADMGIKFGWDAEEMVVVDEKGDIISDQKLLALFCLLNLRKNSDIIIAVPVNATSIIDKLANEYCSKVIRTKTDGRNITHTASTGEHKIAFAGDTSGRFIFPQFHPSFDAMFSFARLLELLSYEQHKLSELVEFIPPFYLSSKTIDCPWQLKGKIMRSLIEENREKNIELIDGIKIYAQDSWVLMLPDPIDPKLHISSEAIGQKEADYLVEIISERILHLKEEETSEDKAKAKDILANIKMQRIMACCPPEKAFYFWLKGRPLGLAAHDIKELYDILHYVDVESIEFHNERGDFSKWIKDELADFELYEEFAKLHHNGHHGEDLRNNLLKTIKIKGGL